MAAQIKISKIGVPNEKDTGISRSVVVSADQPIGPSGSAFTSPTYKDKPLSIDSAVPKRSPGKNGDARAVNAPSKANGGYLFGDFGD